MKKCKLLLATLCLAFVSILSLGFVSLANPMAKASEEPTYYYDTARIYDWAEISDVTSGYMVAGNNVMLDAKTGGKGFANKGIAFKWTFNQDDNSYAALRFQMAIGPDNCNYNRTDTYYFGLDWGWKIWHKVRNEAANAWADDVKAGGVHGWDRIAKDALDSVIIEFSIVKAYDDAEKTNWVANLVTLKINGEVECQMLDNEAEHSWQDTHGITYYGGYKTRANSIDRMRAVDETRSDFSAVGDSGLTDEVGSIYPPKEYTYDTATVYEISDVAAGKEVVEYTAENNVIGHFPAAENVALKFEYNGSYKTSSGVQKPYVLGQIGFMFDDENTGWDDAEAGQTQKGIWLQLWDWGYRFSSNSTLSADGVLTGGGSDSDRILSGVEYVLEVGVVNQYENGDKVGYLWYFEVNGVRKLEVVRPLTYDKSGLAIVFGENYEDYMRKFGSYTMLSDLGFVQTTYDDVTVYDYEDLTGEYKAVVSAAEIGEMTEKVNSAVSLKAKASGAAVGFTLHDRYTFAHASGKYSVAIGNEKVEAEGTLTDDSALEMGVKKCYQDGSFAGYFAYLAVDGEVVVSLLDETVQESDLTGAVAVASEYLTAMNGVVELCSVGPYLPKEYQFDKLVVYDLFDLLGVETLQWTGLPVFAQLPTSENVAFRFLVDGNGYHKDGQLLFSLVAFSTEDNGWRTSGYSLEIDWQFKLFQQAKQVAFKEGNVPNTGWQEVEIGCVKGYREGEWVGNYVYLKVNGEEVCSFIDTTTYQNLGKNIAFSEYTMGCKVKHAEGCTGAECDTLGCQKGVILGTTYDFYQATVESRPEQVHIDDEFLLIKGKEGGQVIPLTVDLGYELTKVYINGEDKTAEVLVKGENGGYKMVLVDVQSDMTFRFEVEEKTFSVSVTAPQDLTVNAPATIGYAGKVVVTFTPTVGKMLTSVKMNDAEMISDCEFSGGVYTLTVYGVTENLVFVAATEEKSFTVSANVVGTGASVSIENASVLAYGTARVTVTLQDGWVIKSVVCNGETVSVDANGVFVVEYLRENLEIQVTVEEIVPDVEEPETPTESSGGCACSGSMPIGGLVGLTLLAVVYGVRRKKKEM